MLLAALVVGAVACGPAPDGGSRVAGGGTGGTGITNGVSHGSITGFGSIILNGVRFDTTKASITRDGVAIGEHELRIGMTVEALGRIETSASGVADAIVVAPSIRGPIESTGSGYFVVLGQTVVLNDLTRFDANVPAAANLSTGDFVEVHGFSKAPGIVSARLVQRRAPSLTYLLQGLISAHDVTANTFTIGTLTVNYGAAVIDAMPSGDWTGMDVTAIGTQCASAPVCTTLAAGRVVPRRLTMADAETVELEGFVTTTSLPSEFLIGNQPVRIDASTLFSGGTVVDIALGTRVEVEGRLVAGTVEARRVIYQDNIHLKLNALTVNLGLGTLTLAGLPGITVQIDSQTQYGGLLSGLGDIGLATHLRVQGRTIGSSTVLATRIEASLFDNVAILQAPAESVSGSIVILLGRSINADAVSVYKNVRGDVISREAFLTELAVGRLVRATGSIGLLNAITWQELQLQE
jgi:hypothetical protein